MAGASAVGEEFEVTSRPSKQTRKKAQGELAQAKRPLFTTPEGETVEVAGLVEEEASSATSLAKTGEATKGSSKSINLVKSGAGKTLKEFDSTLLERYDGHIFSVKHREYGIMKLGSSKETIKKIFLKKILEADALGKLQNNVLNQIVTEINGYETVIKVFNKC